tara:strand:+ start:1703 stop:3241 length:1539 start_codon:yes stop_codon:yes gene_type:complete
MEKSELIEEFRKCKDDPVYFISNYIKVTHPVRGLVPFKLYPFQEDILAALKNNRFNILRKFRQAGCTTISAAYSLWMIVFQKHKQVVILSKGDAESTEVLDRIKIMYEELPDFLRPQMVEDNKHTMKLSTGSTIKSRPSGKQSGRSLAGSLLIIDEAAFIDNIHTIWAAVYPIISTGGRAFVLSTVNGIGNWYYDVYHKAVAGENSFNAIDINWQSHPEYKRMEGYEPLYEEMEKKGLFVDKWEDTTRINMPFKQWLQEYECEFLGTGDTYLEGYLLRRLVEDDISEDYWIKYNNKMRVWKEPLPEYEYAIGVDVSLGRERDHSAFHIINVYSGEQVAEFYSNKTPINELAQILANEANLYNNASVIIERNTIGNNLIDWMFNVLEYDNLWVDDKNDFGLQITTRNREELLARMEEFIRNNFIKINSKRTIDELLTFIIDDNGKITADEGKHDDLIMSLSSSVFLLHTLRGSMPLEMKTNTTVESKPLEPFRTVITDGMDRELEEDMRWLMK